MNYKRLSSNLSFKILTENVQATVILPGPISKKYHNIPEKHHTHPFTNGNFVLLQAIIWKEKYLYTISITLQKASIINRNFLFRALESIYRSTIPTFIYRTGTLFTIW